MNILTYVYITLCVSIADRTHNNTAACYRSIDDAYSSNQTKLILNHKRVDWQTNGWPRAFGALGKCDCDCALVIRPAIICVLYVCTHISHTRVL